MKFYNNVLELIGNTPLLRLNKITKGIEATMLLKLESMNPGGSVKDRIGISMLEAAERDGLIAPGSLIVEPTSGNTGIGLALAARLKGYRCLFVMTDKASGERVRYLKALGADVLIVSSAAKMTSPEYYWNTAKRLSEELPNAIMLNQYDNAANPSAHELTTGPEIWEATEGKVTHFVAGIGTGGTITGTARYLKSMNPNIKIYAADPVGSAIKTFKDTGRLVEALPYLVEGVGQERIPGNLDVNLIDEIINVTDYDSFNTARLLVREEGVFCGGSSGMNVAAALKIGKGLPASACVVTIICDTGERYLTKHHNDEWLKEKSLLDNEKLLVRDILSQKKHGTMVPGVVSVASNSTVQEALSLMASYEVSDIPVITAGVLDGLIREGQVMSTVLNNRDVLTQPVSSHMDAAPPVLDINADKPAAIRQLKDNSLVLVSEFGRYVGVITRHDILSYL